MRVNLVPRIFFGFENNSLRIFGQIADHVTIELAHHEYSLDT